MLKPTTTQAEGVAPFAQATDPDIEEQEALLQLLIVTLRQYFGGWLPLFGGLTDGRVPGRITYELASVMATGVLMFLFRLGARRQIHLWLRNNHASAVKYQAYFKEERCPHGDTLNYAYIRSQVDELQEVVTGMTSTLIRRKVLYPYRLLDKYHLVAIDGTGVLTYDERHCPHCLTRTSNGHTLYYHPVLEAKLVTPTGLAFSLMTEFIENPGENPTKQDCELRACYRLLQRLKQRFPRLPICLTLDGLYAGGPTFALCEQHRWKYLVVLQEGSIPYINDEFKALSKLEPGNHLRFETGVQWEIKQDLRWVNEIAYVDTENREHSVGVIECLETKPDDQQSFKTTRFKWVTNFTLKASNVVTLANQGGRTRWKIENEGFNVQKNGGYALEHRYSEHPTASKIFYLLLQIAHMLAQLIERGSLFSKAFPDGVGSAKNLAARLLEAWRNLRLSSAACVRLLDVRVRIRLIPP